jgi:hypothetical protein
MESHTIGEPSGRHDCGGLNRQRRQAGNHITGEGGDASAKCKSVRKQHAILPDSPGDLTSASKYF